MKKDKLLTITQNTSLSKIILDIIRRNSNTGFGCSPKVIWEAIVSAQKGEVVAGGYMIRFENPQDVSIEDMDNVLNLLVSNGDIELKLWPQINSVSFHLVHRCP